MVFKLEFLFVCVSIFNPLLSIVSANTDQNSISGMQCRPPLPQPVAFALDTFKLHELASLEAEFYKDLKKFYNSASKDIAKSESLQSYLQDYEESVLNIVPNANKGNNETEMLLAVVSNPISMYRMIRRLVVQFKKLEQDFKESSAIEKFRVSAEEGLPTENDLRDAVEGLLRVHYVHELQASQLSQGIVQEKKTHVTLNAVQCLEIGQYAMTVARYTLAIDWLETAKKIAKLSNKDDEKLQSDIENELITAKTRHDAARKELRKEPIYSRRYLFTKKVLNKNSTGRVTIASIIRNKKFRRSSSLSNIEAMDLCAGYNFQSEELKSKLKCWLETKKHPYWRINPLKMEQLNLEPELVQIYDFIGDENINKISTAARPMFVRSEILNENMGNTEYSSIRTSVNGWLGYADDEDNSFMEKLNFQIEFATGLTVAGESTMFQVVEYSALGSHYDLHIDALEQKEQIPEGERIATFMIYLTDVEMGGFTSLPLMNTATKPIKGSAVLWYNVSPDGSVDTRSCHGGCPVLSGKKMIANKWIHAHNNIFNRKCQLTKDF